MARRNGIFRQISQNLYDEGLRQEVADKMAQQAMRMGAEMKKKMKKMTGHAGGQGGMTTSVDIFMMCKPDMKIKCNATTYKFRTYDAHCNNVEGSGFEGTAGMKFIRDVPVGQYDPKDITVYEELIPATEQGSFKCQDKCKYLIDFRVNFESITSIFPQMVALQERIFLVLGWSVELLSQTKTFQVRDQRIFMSNLGNSRAMT